jgi:hypothetical protein
MAGVAGSLGGLGEEIAQSARSAETFGAVRAIFSSTRLSLNNLRDAVFPVTAAMSSLITATAPFLPGLASGFADLAQRVAVFVDTAAQSGRISAAFQAAMSTLRDLGGIALNVGSILGSVFRAASVGSGSLLGNLRALTGQVAAFLRSAQGSAALTTVFSTLATLGNALRTSLAAVLPAVARSLAIIGPVLAGLAGPAAQLVVALAPLLPYFTSLAAIVLRTLTPAIAALAGWMTQHATTVRVLGTAVAGLVIGMRLLAVAERAQIAIAGLAKSVTLAWAIATGTAGTAAAGASIGVRLLGAAIRFMMGPIGIVITVIGLLAAAFVYLFNHNKTFHDAVIATWNGIKAAVSAVGSWFTGTLFPSIRTAIDQGAAAWGVLRGAVMAAWNGVRSVVTTVGAAISAVFRGIGAVVTWLAQTIFAPYFRLIGAIVHAAWVVIQVAAAAIRYEFTFIGRVAQALYTTYILPVFRAIGAVVRALYTATVQPVVNLIRNAWNAMGTAIRAVWAGIILPVFRVFVSTAVSTGNTLRGWFANIRNFFSGMANGIRAVWTGTILPVFNALITGVRDRVAGAFRVAVSAIRSAWDRVRDAARTPIAFVVNSVIRPFVGGINNAAAFFNIRDRIPVPARMAHGGLLDPHQLPGYALGGRIAGLPSAVDNRLAPATIPGVGAVKLAGGEFIVNADDTRKALPLLKWINGGMRGEPRLDAIPPGTPYRHGGEIPGFQGGGLIGWAKGLIGKGAKAVANVFKTIADPSGTIKKIANAAINAIPGGGGIRNMVVGAARKLLDQAIGWLTSLGGTGGAAGIVGNASPGFPPWPASPSAQRGDSGVWRKVVALIRSTGPVSGSFGNAYRPGDPLWHGSGRAVDWMGYNQDALATFLANRRPLELIHRTGRRDYAYTRGRNKGSFNNALMQAHRNHVHIAMAGGGLLPAAGLPLRLFDTGGAWPSGTLGANLSGRTEYVSTDRSAPTVEFHAHFHAPVGDQRAAENLVYGAWKRLKRDGKLT